MSVLVLPRYLIRQFLTRSFFITLALGGMLLVFDLLSNIVSITEHHPDLINVIFQYLWLRTPSILMLAIPMSVLISAMTTFFRLISNQELVAVFSAGLPIYYVAFILSLGAILPAALQFYLSDKIVPSYSSRLESWESGDFKNMPPSSRRPLLPAWFSAGPDLVYASEASADGSRLDDVVILRRNKSGVTEQYFKARQALYRNQQWQLIDANIANVAGKSGEFRARTAIDISLDPDALLQAGRSLSSMSLKELAAHKSGPVYTLWIQRKLAAPFECFIMVILAASLGLQRSRRNTMLGNSFIVIAAGFAYFLAERLLLSLGEAGILPVFPAVWAPALIFGMLGWWFLLYKQE